MTIEEIMGTQNTNMYEATIEALAAKTTESQATLRRLSGQQGNDRRFSARTERLAGKYAATRHAPQP
ncbi:MAG: hypothetical protein EOM37_07345 [Proteobacteria bacterium]|jgi:hypothetical protein|nr:hypothetical protein [Alphaproteobacteria bacterium]NCC03844.1 hypothetical protein [Pseudomonadota bacterium]